MRSFGKDGSNIIIIIIIIIIIRVIVIIIIINIRYFFAEKSSSAVSPGRRPILAKNPDFSGHYINIPAASPGLRAVRLGFRHGWTYGTFCRKDLRCRRPGLVRLSFWQGSAVDPSLPKTPGFWHYVPAANLGLRAFARNFGKAGPTALFLPKRSPVP